MRKDVRWFEYGENGEITRMGVAPVRTIQNWIKDRGREAVEIVREHGIKAEHVVYAAKYYGDDGELEKVSFYCKPMTESEFEDILAIRDCIVYALHKGTAY